MATTSYPSCHVILLIILEKCGIMFFYTYIYTYIYDSVTFVCHIRSLCSWALAPECCICFYFDIARSMRFVLEV